MVYVVTTFLSAFLLFMVQPLMGKLVLPWFGGSPGVWTTCMLFFQVTLLGGYGYAHLLASRFRPRTQAWIHVSLLATALALMGFLCTRWGSPLLPGEAWKPTGAEAPVPHILLLLFISIGLPYLLLSATSPLLQRWFSLRGHGEKTYRLYAVSNAGSLLGLLSYPFLTERFLPLPVQAVVWALAFVVFAAGCLVTAMQLRRSDGASESKQATEATATMPRSLTILMWVLLTMSTSAMLLAVTNAMCQEVASVPFLWVLPLSLYLLSFIIAFDRPQWYRRRFFVLITAALTVAVLVTHFLGIRLLIPTHIISFSTFLFFFCMTCHGELVGLKPAPRFLTLFYLLVALGGALGGVFVGLLAPVLFTSYWEFNIMATVAWIILALVFIRDKASFFYRGDRWHFYLLAAFVLFVALRLTLPLLLGDRETASWLSGIPTAAALTLLLVGTGAWFLRNRSLPSSRYWPRILIGAVIFLAECFMIVRVRSTAVQTVAAERNFFGTLRVQVSPADPERHPPILRLVHGQINHGFQYQHEELRHLPVSYYGPESGIDYAVRFHPRRHNKTGRQPLRLGVLGLGTGTMAAFAKPGDTTRFYEINPDVIDYAAGDTPMFTYLRDSKGDTEVVLGDARLALERELDSGQPQQFDILVMDAFSSDSIPIHLLTREAFEVYNRHLRDDDSVIAINISNRFLDFRDLMASTAADTGYAFGIVDVREISLRKTPSRWALFTKNPNLFRHPETEKRFQIWTPTRRIVWTDSFSNLLHLLK